MLCKLGCVRLQYIVSTLIHWLKGVYFDLKKRDRQLRLRVRSYKLISALHINFTAGYSIYPARGSISLCHRILFPIHILISGMSGNGQNWVNLNIFL